MAGPYSYSQIAMYKSCPFSWQCKYQRKIKSMDSKPALDGREVHAAIKAYIDHLVEHRLRTSFEWESIIEELNLSTEAEMVFTRFARNFALDWRTHVGSEVEIAVDEKGRQYGWWDNRVWLRGILDKIDIIGDTLHITDYKGGHKTEIDQFQLRSYAWLAHYKYPHVKRFRVTNHFIRQRLEKTEEYSLRQVALTRSRIRRIVRTIEADKKFKKTPGDHCVFCPYRRICSRGMALVKTGQITEIVSMEQAVKYAGQLLLMEALTKEARRRIKMAVDQFGPIRLDAGTYGYHENESKVVKDKEAMWRWLEERRLNPIDFMTFDMRKLKKVVADPIADQIKVKFGFEKTA